MTHDATQPPLHELYAAHRRRALAVARRILKDPSDAEDVVQDVFSRLCDQASAFRGQAAYGTWLHRVVVNSSLNFIRARKRRAKLVAVPGDPGCPEEHASRRELTQQFLRAVESLPEPFRQVIWLREVRGFSYPQIARMLGMPEGTVKSALHRARLRVARVMNVEPDVVLAQAG